MAGSLRPAESDTLTTSLPVGGVAGGRVECIVLRASTFTRILAQRDGWPLTMPMASGGGDEQEAHFVCRPLFSLS